MIEIPERSSISAESDHSRLAPTLLSSRIWKRYRARRHNRHGLCRIALNARLSGLILMSRCFAELGQSSL